MHSVPGFVPACYRDPYATCATVLLPHYLPHYTAYTCAPDICSPVTLLRATRFLPYHTTRHQSYAGLRCLAHYPLTPAFVRRVPYRLRFLAPRGRLAVARHLLRAFTYYTPAALCQPMPRYSVTTVHRRAVLPLPLPPTRTACTAYTLRRITKFAVGLVTVLRARTTAPHPPLRLRYLRTTAFRRGGGRTHLPLAAANTTGARTPTAAII